MMKKFSRSRGFTLMELLLSLVVFVVLLMAVFSLLQTYILREQGRSANKYMTTVADAIEQMLRDVNAFDAIYAQASIGNNGFELLNPPTGNIAVNGYVIQAPRMLNSQFSNVSPLNTPVRILFRVGPAGRRSLEVIVVTADPRPRELVYRAASEAGNAGGYIDAYANKNVAVMTGAFKNWRVQINPGLQGTAWYSTELANNMAAAAGTMYLVHYKYLDRADVAGDYLHRNPPTGGGPADINTMQGPLTLGGHNIIGADDVTITGTTAARALTAADIAEQSLDAQCLNNNLCVRGTGVVKGSASVGRAMYVNGSTMVSMGNTPGPPQPQEYVRINQLQLENNVTDAQRSTMAARSEFIADGGGSTADLVAVTNNATFSGGLTAATGTVNATTTAETVAIPENSILDVDGSILTMNEITADSIDAQRLNPTHKFSTVVLNGGSVVLPTGRAGVIQIDGARDMNIPNGTVSVNKINVKSLNIGAFGTCSHGCGN